ncbi:hypothetical protein ES705_33083 [subsurface metagenome]
MLNYYVIFLLEYNKTLDFIKAILYTASIEIKKRWKK